MPSDPSAECETDTADRDTAECDTEGCTLSWERVQDRLRREHPNRVSLSDAARMLLVSVSSMRHHVRHLGEVQWISIGGRTFRTFDRKLVLAYANKRKRIRISRCAFQGIEVERLERICETYVRQNLDIAPPELLALAKRIAKL